MKLLLCPMELTVLNSRRALDPFVLMLLLVHHSPSVLTPVWFVQVFP